MKGGVIIVEGNIGAGKSTFAAHLAAALGGEYLPEPDEASNPFLADYYSEPGRWAFEMQMFLLTRRYRAQKYAQSKARHFGGGFVVMDRSYYGDVCFAHVQRQLGHFSERDYSTYMQHHTDMKAGLEPPAMAIFLDVDSITCQRRILRRMSSLQGRACESAISLDYLERLGREIALLAEDLGGHTIVKRLGWGEEKSDEQISWLCHGLARDVQCRPDAIFDVWTGTRGAGHPPADLEGRAAWEAQL